MSTEAPERLESADWFPTEEEYRREKRSRQARGMGFQVFALAMLAVAVLALATLLMTIIGDSFGLTAVVNERDPADVVESLGYDPATTTIEDLSYDERVGLLVEALGEGSGVGRRLEREQRFYDDRFVFEDPAVYAELCAADEPVAGCTAPVRDDASVTQLVYERVVVPDVIASYEFLPSLLDPGSFEAEVRETFELDPGRFEPYTFDDVGFEWRAWFNWTFITSPSSSTPEIAGIRTAILGSAWLMLITLLFSVPVGVGAAIYLNEFAKPSRLNDFVQTNIYNLAGVPSIIYGMLGLAVFVRIMEPITSGAIFTDGIPPSDNGRTILAGGLTLGLLILPVVIISAQEALKAVPNYLRTGGLALGATKWQTVRSQVLPVAFPGILTGTILAISRAIGETAPLILVGAAGFITSDPTGPFSKFTALPIQIFQWTSFPQQEFRNIAAAASIALLILLLLLNGTAVFLRNRFSRRA
jgi:phosphate transport system permease protein